MCEPAQPGPLNQTHAHVAINKCVNPLNQTHAYVAINKCVNEHNLAHAFIHDLRRQVLRPALQTELVSTLKAR